MSKQIRFFILPSICLAVLLLAACGGKFSSPESTTRSFLSALVKKDFGLVFEHMRPEDKAEISAEDKSDFEAWVEENALVDFEILGSEIDGDEASVEVSWQFESSESDQIDFDLEKYEGKWYIWDIWFTLKFKGVTGRP